jgi:hypothetical protein
MITHLISTTEFVKLISNVTFDRNGNVNNFYNILNTTLNYEEWCYRKIVNYAKFISQKPELWMFIPCDEEGNILKEPKINTNRANGFDVDDFYLEQYQKAQSKVLFKGWVYNQERKMIRDIKDTCGFILPWDNTIEELMNRNFELKLTETALKQIGL